MALLLIEGRENVVDKKGPSRRDVGEMLEAEGSGLRALCVTPCVVIQLPCLRLHGALGLQEGGGRSLQGGLLDMEEGGRDLTSQKKSAQFQGSSTGPTAVQQEP